MILKLHTWKGAGKTIHTGSTKLKVGLGILFAALNFYAHVFQEN